MPGLIKNLIVTGNPGIGKTTLIKECILPFRERTGGFYTEEIKEGDERAGFLIKTLDGQEGIFAKKGLKSSAKLNKYGINLNVLESLGVRAVQKALEEKAVVVIDEIGAMEILSPLFCSTVTEALQKAPLLLATIRLKAEPFTSQIKKMSETKLVVLTRENYSLVKSQIRQWLEGRVPI